MGDELPAAPGAEGRGAGTVRVEREGPVTTITIDRPAVRNAVDGPTAACLAGAFRAFDADPEAAVAVLTGAGGTFCAGADLRAFEEGRANRLEPDGDGPMGPTRLELGKPVIAAIEGFAVAGGLELACWCDLRVVGEGATFGVFCRRWGVPLIDGGTVRLPRIVGRSHAMDLILTGRAVASDEAHRIGLANRVVPRGEALAAAQALALELARFPQATLRADRRSALAGEALEERAALDQEFRGGLETIGDALEGARRFSAGHGRHGRFDDL